MQSPPPLIELQGLPRTSNDGIKGLAYVPISSRIEYRNTLFSNSLWGWFCCLRLAESCTPLANNIEVLNAVKVGGAGLATRKLADGGVAIYRNHSAGLLPEVTGSRRDFILPFPCL